MMTSRAHCERCQVDVEPVLVDALGEALFPVWVCGDCGEEVAAVVRREGPEPPTRTREPGRRG
jgi:hypothetical protein